MKKLLSLPLSLCIVFALAACGSSTDSSPSSEPSASDSSVSENTSSDSGTGAFDGTLTIGLIGPMTGSLATYGTAMQQGLELAVEEINAAGGILGMEVEVVVADDRGDASECLLAFNTLVSQGIGIIIGAATSGCTSAITQAANEEGVVLITPSATADSITTEDDYVFRACFRDSLQGDIAAAFVEQQGYTKVGTIACSADTYSQGLVDAFKVACESRGIEVVATESTASMSAQDFTNQFATMASAGAELVYAIYYYDAVGPFLITQARAAGYDGAIMGGDGYDGSLGYISSGVDYSAFNDVYWTNHYDPSNPNEAVQTFVAAFEEMFGSTPISFSALTYDCMYMIAQAADTCGSADAASVRDQLSDTSVVYDCVTGSFSLDESGTPTKGGVVIEYYYDPDVEDDPDTDEIESIGQRLVSTITSEDLTQ